MVSTLRNNHLRDCLDEVGRVASTRGETIFIDANSLTCRLSFGSRIKPISESVPFPGIATTADGSEAAVWVETRITQGACAYPITPSTNMGGGYQLAVANGQRNLWGEPLAFLELESEHSSASTCEGFALAGGRVANFTSGQGLILMKEVLYVIAGKRLPAVFHIGARTLTSQGLNIHAGHDDVMGVADCGWGCCLRATCRRPPTWR
jgi:pyruvate-ferredoxin/flavodoxin oxidoreductase